MWVSRTPSQCAANNFKHLKSHLRKCLSTWAEALVNSPDRAQAFVSQSFDPYVNLSLENYLLQKSEPDTLLLLFYTNKPSVVIGRNQNPWLEANLALLRNAAPLNQSRNASSGASNVSTKIELVRRRSGGGTVFHDEGNINWTVICPSAIFTRDKHAEMVAKALRHLGKDKVRVNKRHDIVIDHDLPHPFQPFKISGSAYKITRSRALHHGTCLLSSPNIQMISQYLRSPAKQYIEAKGVESVGSPVANINLTSQEFVDAVSKEFYSMYGNKDGQHATKVISLESLQIDEISQGIDELKNPLWKYGQTPQFTFTMESKDLNVMKDFLPADSGHNIISLAFKARSGIITESNLGMEKIKSRAEIGNKETDLKLEGLNLYTIEDWEAALVASGISTAIPTVTQFLEKLFPSKHMLP